MTVTCHAAVLIIPVRQRRNRRDNIWQGLFYPPFKGASSVTALPGWRLGALTGLKLQRFYMFMLKQVRASRNLLNN